MKIARPLHLLLQLLLRPLGHAVKVHPLKEEKLNLLQIEADMMGTVVVVVAVVTEINNNNNNKKEIRIRLTPPICLLISTRKRSKLSPTLSSSS
jgi:hypothetical protein